MSLGVRRTLTVATFCIGAIASATADHVDDVITAEMARRQVPGLSLAAIASGKIIREQAYGLADVARKQPVLTTTLFQAASISKAVAAVGALHLVEQNKVALDENINAKLSSWKLPENQFTQERVVTLRLILSHRAGLTVHGFSPGYLMGQPIPSLVQILDGRAPAHSAPVRVNIAPGTKYRYSGGGYLVMQQMMTDVTGQSFADYIEETVFKPLGMSSSTFSQPLPSAWLGVAAVGYTGEPRHPIPGGSGVYPELAAAGLWTTAGDLARFYIGMQRSLTGTANPTISAEMTRAMLTAQSGDSGLGFMVGGNPRRFGHNGAHAGFNAISLCLESGEGAVILMNADTDIDALQNVLIAAIGEEYHWPGYPLRKR
jgi:CubicO group peptidase (beta-lactamase class C family)